MGRNFEDTTQSRVRKRARHGYCCAGAVKAGANDAIEIAPKRGIDPRQWALCGSDQADNRVTTSNSRRSLATTWFASSFVDNAST